jgi:hypothetical protein
MKKQMKLMVIAAAVVTIVLAYLLLAGRRTQCDTIFEQTATRVGGNLDIIKNKGELFVGREQVQALTEGAQKVGLHLKSCCLSQQTGNMTHDEFQDCINGAKDYESKVLLVTKLINEAQAAKNQGNEELAQQKAGQAREAVSAVTSASSELGKTAANLSSDPVSIKSAEQEPNNTILQANAAEMGTTISGEVSTPDDQDFFKFSYKDPKNRRDLLRLHIENRSTTLQPQFQVYNEDKSSLQNWSGANAAGANLDFSFVAEPGRTYYVAVGSYSGTGKYALSLIPQKAYDQFEPNEDAFTATPIRLGQTIDANIMDNKDVDWYRLSGVQGKTVTVHLENLSDALQPQIQIRNGDKSVLQDWNGANAPGANLEINFPAESGKDYFVIVGSYSNAGKYKLTTH